MAISAIMVAMSVIAPDVKVTPASSSMSVGAFLARAVQEGKYIGGGSEGGVIEFKSDDPFFGQFLFKIRRDHVKNESARNAFCRSLNESTALTPVPNSLEGKNYGQSLLEDSKHRFSILLRQPGETLNKMIGEILPLRFGKEPSARSSETLYHDYLRWLISDDVPESSLLQMHEKLRFAKIRGYHVDHASKGNVLWDEGTKQFNFVDMFEHKPTVVEEVQAAIQRPGRAKYGAYAVMTGLTNPKMTAREEIFRLLTYSGINHRHQINGDDTRPTEAEWLTTLQLQEQLQAKVDRAVPDRKAKVKHEIPAPNIQVSSIADISKAQVADLKVTLSKIVDSYGIGR